MKTGLRIRVIEGKTVNGRTEYEFPASQTGDDMRIVVGRDPEQCQIVFVDELRHQGLGNEHLALRRSLGRYQLDLNTRNPVLLNGRKTFEEKELTGTSVLQLGQAVKLEVTVVDDRTATAFDDHSIQQPEEVAMGNRRLLAGIAAGLGLLALGGTWIGWRQQAADRVLRDMSEATVSSATLDHAAKSVYLIVRKAADGGEDAVGTGWSGPGGVIVTNAHVVEGIPSSPDDVRWFARSAAPPHAEHAITGVRMHPGYATFSRFLMAAKPIQEHIAGPDEGIGGAGACDVAIIDVENPAGLAAPLPIPSREKLKELQAGDAVATVGFPAEGLAATPILLAAPVPVRHRGFLVRITDFFMRQREDGVNQLVQHGLPTAGGASGSPIIDTEGNVVAVVSGGNMQFVTGAGDGVTNRIANNVVNFAQRSDLVLDLLEGTAGKRLDDYVDMWIGSMKDFRNASDIVVRDFMQETAAIIGRPDIRPEAAGEELIGDGLVVKTPDELTKAVPVELQLPRGVFTVLARPKVPVDIDASVTDSRGNRVGLDESLHFHGLFRLVNRHPQTYRLNAWFAGEGPPFSYGCQVLDWQCDPDEFLARWFASSVNARFLRTNVDPAFDARSSASLLKGASGSPARGRVSLPIAVPGFYVAWGEVSAPVPIALSLSAGGLSIEADTVPTTKGGPEPVRSQTPYVIFRVVEPDAEVQFDCEAPEIKPGSETVEATVRVIGWPGVDVPADGRQ
jgi:hypothetical protein